MPFVKHANKAVSRMFIDEFCSLSDNTARTWDIVYESVSLEGSYPDEV